MIGKQRKKSKDARNLGYVFPLNDSPVLPVSVLALRFFFFGCPDGYFFGRLASDMETQSVLCITLIIGTLGVISLSPTCDKACKVCNL